MKYKYIGTEEQLIKNGFEIINMAIVRARRNCIKIFTGTTPCSTRNDWEYDNDAKTIFNAYSHYENMPKNHKLEKNIVYDEYKEKELDDVFLIQDLIDKGLVEVIGE